MGAEMCIRDRRERERERERESNYEFLCQMPDFYSQVRITSSACIEGKTQAVSMLTLFVTGLFYFVCVFSCCTFSSIHGLLSQELPLLRPWRVTFVVSIVSA